MRFPTDAFTQGCVDGVLSGRLFWKLRVMDGLCVFKSDDSSTYYAILDLWEPDTELERALMLDKARDYAAATNRDVCEFLPLDFGPMHDQT